MKQAAVFKRAILAVEIALLADAPPEAIVRAVMEAMMEPSEGMVQHGDERANICLVVDKTDDEKPMRMRDRGSRSVWQAMVRAAMDENVEG